MSGRRSDPTSVRLPECPATSRASGHGRAVGQLRADRMDPVGEPSTSGLVQARGSRLHARRGGVACLLGVGRSLLGQLARLLLGLVGVRSGLVGQFARPLLRLIGQVSHPVAELVGAGSLSVAPVSFVIANAFPSCKMSEVDLAEPCPRRCPWTHPSTRDTGPHEPSARSAVAACRRAVRPAAGDQ